MSDAIQVQPVIEEEDLPNTAPKSDLAVEFVDMPAEHEPSLDEGLRILATWLLRLRDRNASKPEVPGGNKPESTLTS